MQRAVQDGRQQEGELQGITDCLVQPQGDVGKTAGWFRGQPALSASDAEIADWFRGQPSSGALAAGNTAGWFRGQPSLSATDAEIADWFRGQPSTEAVSLQKAQADWPTSDANAQFPLLMKCAQLAACEEELAVSQLELAATQQELAEANQINESWQLQNTQQLNLIASSKAVQQQLQSQYEALIEQQQPSEPTAADLEIGELVVHQAKEELLQCCVLLEQLRQLSSSRQAELLGLEKERAQLQHQCTAYGRELESVSSFDKHFQQFCKTYEHDKLDVLNTEHGGTGTASAARLEACEAERDQLLQHSDAQLILLNNASKQLDDLQSGELDKCKSKLELAEQTCRTQSHALQLQRAHEMKMLLEKEADEAELGVCQVAFSRASLEQEECSAQLQLLQKTSMSRKAELVGLERERVEMESTICTAQQQRDQLEGQLAVCSQQNHDLTQQHDVQQKQLDECRCAMVTPVLCLLCSLAHCTLS